MANEHQSVSYVWQMKSDTSAAEPLRCAFSIAYQLTSGEDAQTGHCTCDFTLENYQVRRKAEFLNSSRLKMWKQVQLEKFLHSV